MTREEIKEGVISILKRYTREDEVWQDFEESFDIIKDLKINSARIIDVVIELEDKFKIRFSIPELDQIIKVQDGIDCIESKLNLK